MAAGRELLAYVEAGARGVLRIRHLYDQTVKDLTANYEQPIQELHLTHLNYLVLVTDQKTIEVSLLRVEAGAIQMQQIKGFKKANMSQMYCHGRWLVTPTANTMDLYEFKEAEMVNKLKCEISSVVKHITMNGDSIYTYSVDGRVRHYNVQAPQASGRELFSREGVQAIDSFSVAEREYLAIVGEDNVLEVLPVGNGDSQQLPF